MMPRSLLAILLALSCAVAARAQDEPADAPAGDVVPEGSEAPPEDAPSMTPLPSAGAAPSSIDEALNAADAPQYRVKPCCDLCPSAADPASYRTSKYFEDSAVLQQGKEGWLFRSRLDLNSSIQISDESLAGLKQLVDTLHAVGTELVLVYQPPRGLADADKLSPGQRKGYDFRAAKQSYIAAMARLRTTGAIVPPFEKLIDEGKGYDYFFRRDHHWTPTGSEKTAQIVADTVRALPAYRGIPQKKFRTHVAGIISKPGSLQKIAQQICGGTYSMQFIPGFATEPEGGGGGGGLLDEEATPSITLVGTSNSDDRGGYNFGGYLEQYLQADILNVAITGGSFEGSLLHYLPSEAFQKHPPKIMIWEMPYQDFPGTAVSPHRIFRQAVALVGNGCAGKPATLEKTAQLHAGENEILFNGGGKVLPIVGHDYVFDFQFSDPGVKELHSTFWYMNGMRERLQLRFKQYVDNKGRFVAKLRADRPDYANATFMGATVELPSAPAKPISVTAKMCPMDVSQVAANAGRGAIAGKSAAPKETAPVSAMELAPAPAKHATHKVAPKPAATMATPSAPAAKSRKAPRVGKPAVTYSTGKAKATTPAAPPKPARKPVKKSVKKSTSKSSAAPASKAPPTQGSSSWAKTTSGKTKESAASLPDEPGTKWSVSRPPSTP